MPATGTRTGQFRREISEVCLVKESVYLVDQGVDISDSNILKLNVNADKTKSK